MGGMGGPPPRSSGGGFLGGFLMGSLMNRRPTVVVADGGGRGPVRGGGSGGRGGCAGAIVTLVVLALLGALVAAFMPSCSSGYTEQNASTVIREELAPGSVTETAYYTDQDGDWIHDPAALESGMRAFYEKTGVQPYVYILPNGTTTSVSQLTDLAEELYDQLFSDEGHFLLVFCDDGNGSYTCGYAIGSLAANVMDSEACSILATQIERAYNDYSLSEEEIFSEAFANTADLIMGAAERKQTSDMMGTVGLAVVGVAVVGGIAVFIVKKKRTADRERREQAEKILNTPLETFGDSDIEDLADKYEDDASS